MNEPVGNDLLSELHLDTAELSREERIAIIRKIYEELLQDDDRWHFFYEEEQGDIIRCSPEFRKSVENWLIKNYISFRMNKLWMESIPEVVNNPEYFADLFHLNSIYIINEALNLDPKSKKISLVSFVDRYSHSLYLNDSFISGNTKFGEGTVLAEAALNRAFYEGIRFQFLRDKPYMDEKAKEKHGN